MTTAQEQRMRELSIDPRLNDRERRALSVVLFAMATQPSDLDSVADVQVAIDNYTALADSRGPAPEIEREPGQEG